MSKILKRQNKRVLQLEQLQKRELMAVDLAGLLAAGNLPTYSIDGTGNNVSQSEWGSTNENLLRLTRPAYADGKSAPAGADRPSARAISNAIADQGDQDIISDRDLSAFVYAWGQFIDHDIGLTPGGSAESISIPVPKGDPYFDPTGTGTKVIRMSRSVFDPTTGTTNPRQQINTITAWIDGSMVYGSDKRTSDALRTFVDGKLKISSDGMLPLNNATNFPNGTLPMANDAHRVSDNQLFAAGDVRANENIELSSLHTLFVREHNRWADRIKAGNPRLSDNEIYQRARALVIAEIQSITYNEWLPAILGPDAMGRYAGYNARVNPGLSNEFSTAAFRFGHSLLGDDIEFLDDNGAEIADAIPLSDAFFNPPALAGKPIDSIFKYLASDPSSELDSKVVGSVRNFLFGPPGAGGFDLAALNIERGREHGLADYNTVRQAVGMPRARTFADITKNRDVQQKLQQLYGSVDKVDLWVGLLAEDRVPGTSMGPTASRIIVEQFQRLRTGDRFWYENAFSGQLLNEIRNTKMSDILKRDTAMRNIQSNVFFFKAEVSGSVFADNNGNARRDRNENGLGRWTVDLVAADGTVVASSVTDASGVYRFDVQKGLRTGQYKVRISKDPTGRALTDSASALVSITRGDQFVRNVDLPVGRPSTTNQAAPVVESSAVAAVDSVFGELDPTRRRRS